MKKYLSLGIILIASSLIAGSVTYMNKTQQESSISLIAKDVILNNKNIQKLQSEVNQINKNEKKINKIVFKKKKYAPNAEVVNVHSFAHFRKTPFGKIIMFLPLHKKLYVSDCNIRVQALTWCKSPNFGGGYIAKNLLKINGIKRK